jgi:CBS domain-containing protein
MKANVEDVMTTRVIWVRKDTPFRELAAALRENRVSAFPVLDEDKKVVGVVSEADMLAKLALHNGQDEMPGMIGGIVRHKQLEKARGITAGDLMTAPPVTVFPGDSIEHAARLMYLRGVKRLPVVDADRHLAGVVSRADVLAVFDRTDDDIRQEVAADVRGEFLADPDAIHIAVKDGVVTLTGVAQPGNAGHEIVRRVRHAQGVVAGRHPHT